MNKQRVFENLEKIIAFEAVARLGSLHKAADELHISQPSLSVKIKNLESNLDCQFLTRNSRGVRLTPQGNELLGFAKQIMQLSEKLSSKLFEDSDSVYGVIKLGVYESIAKYFWPSFSAFLRKSYPELKVQLTVGRSKDLLQKLTDREIDLSISIEPAYKKSVINHDLYQDTFSFYLHPQLAAQLGLKQRDNGDATAKPEELKAIPIILFSSALAENGHPLQEELFKLGVSDFDMTEVDSFDLALEFCLQKMGVAILPERVAKNHFENRKLTRLQIPKMKSVEFSQHRICISSLKDMQDDPLISFFLAEIQRASHWKA